MCSIWMAALAQDERYCTCAILQSVRFTFLRPHITMTFEIVDMYNVYSSSIDCIEVSMYKHSPRLLVLSSLTDLSLSLLQLCVLLAYTKNVNPNALTTLIPTTVHPVTITCLLLNCAPVSHTKCLIPLKLWNVKGNAKNAFNPIFANAGQLANAAAILADSRCQPSSGATR